MLHGIRGALAYAIGEELGGCLVPRKRTLHRYLDTRQRECVHGGLELVGGIDVNAI